MEQNRIHSYLPFGLFILTLIATFTSFSSSFRGLYEAWLTDEYSHGFLIPVLALLIGAHKLAQVKPVVRPSWTGLAVLGVGALLLLTSKLSAFEPPSHYGLVVSLIGLSLGFAGKEATKTLLPVFIYLFFAIPLPRLIYVGLSSELQLISTTLGILPLEWLGLSVYQEGNVIDLGNFKLQVVEACNGLRYLFPLMSFGFLLAIIYDAAMWKRVVLFLSTIPITIGMNSLRIAIIGITVNYWGDGMAKGILHDFEGWTIFSLCLLLLLAEIWVLGKIGGRKGNLRLDYLSLPHGPFFSAYKTNLAPLFAFFLLTILFMGITILGGLGTREEVVPQRTPFTTFPLTLGSWQGKTKALEPDTLRTLDLSDYLMVSYKRPDDAVPSDLYIAYYDNQTIRASIHSPMNCLPGHGWRVETEEIIPIKRSSTEEIPVKRLLIKQDEAAMLVYFWMDQRGRIINEQFGAKWFLLIDSIQLNRTDGALIRLTTPLLPNEPVEEADHRLQALLMDAYPTIRQSVPGNQPLLKP